jgi:amino acid adenylation domain-containing protein
VTASLADLVARAARDNPEGPAVVAGDETVTYVELDRRAGALAATLGAAGVGVGDRVGLYLDKSIDAVVAVHGVLRAGAAYVPLDPKAPVARLAVIAADCELRVIVSQTTKAARWPGLLAEGAPLDTIVLLDGRGSDVDAPLGVTAVDVGTDRPPSVVEPSDDDLAYILYTSGSTGRPKGVMLSHRNGWSFVDWAVRTLSVTRTDRLSSHAPFHFDLSIFDLFAAAMTAAPVVLVPTKATVFPAEAVRFATEQELTIWYSVPSALSMMVTKGGLGPGSLPSLRALVFAGEVFPTPYLAALMELVPHPEYWNWYGPTETNVCTAYRVVDRPDPDDPPLPIGPGIDVVETVVVDEAGDVVDAGGEGELLVRGPTVTAGYYGDPSRTAERLVTRDGVAGWYRTGDLVVDEPDAGFRFRGRRDHQVKSRGHRIELGEVEAALHRHPGVVSAAVVAVPDPLITNRLHAFVVAPGTTAEELVAHCKELVPTYMVPAAVDLLDGLPQTSTGKTDRQALQALVDHAES